MGEAAEDILEGRVCEQCGEWLSDVLEGADGPGHPRRCSHCRPNTRRRKTKQKKAANRPVIIQPGKTSAGGIVNMGAAPLTLYPPAKRSKTIPCPGCTRLFNSDDARDYHRNAKSH